MREAYNRESLSGGPVMLTVGSMQVTIARNVGFGLLGLLACMAISMWYGPEPWADAAVHTDAVLSGFLLVGVVCLHWLLHRFVSPLAPLSARGKSLVGGVVA